MKNKASIFLNGIIKENPVLVLLLGTCPTLATTGSVVSAFAMGVAATAVLFCSNIVISALRKAIPDKVRIPCYIVVIAGFVTVVQMLMEAYLPDLYNMLGIYPEYSLITNIGFGDGATHTTARKTPDEYKSNRDITFPLRHPEYVLPYEPFERHFYMSNNTLFDRIKRLFPFWFKNVVKKIVRG